MTIIRKGDTITIKPEWQDDGDAEFIWIALEDEIADTDFSIKITVTNSELTFPPVYAVRRNMIEKA